MALNTAKVRKARKKHLLHKLTALAAGEPLDGLERLLQGADDGWEGIRQAVIKLAGERGEWAGYPLPVADTKLVIEPRHPLHDTLHGATFSQEKEIDEDDNRVVNSWRDRRGWWVVLYRNEAGKVHSVVVPKNPEVTRMDLVLQTIGASQAWSVRAEFTALERLKTLVTPAAFRYYVLTGTFLETSPKSGVVYLFRKLRPTLALGSGTGMLKCLAALCLHPIGFYERTYAGSMVPTDDVIAHLLMMRGDERRYWAKANQHAIYEPEAGV